MTKKVKKKKVTTIRRSGKRLVERIGSGGGALLEEGVAIPTTLRNLVLYETESDTENAGDNGEEVKEKQNQDSSTGTDVQDPNIASNVDDDHGASVEELPEPVGSGIATTASTSPFGLKFEAIASGNSGLSLRRHFGAIRRH